MAQPARSQDSQKEVCGYRSHRSSTLSNDRLLQAEGGGCVGEGGAARRAEYCSSPSIHTDSCSVIGPVQPVAALAARFRITGGWGGLLTMVVPGRGVDDQSAAQSLEVEAELHLQVIAPQSGSGLEDEVHARR